MTDRLLKVAEVAERLSVTDSTVYRWIDDGSLPAISVGPKSTRVRESDLEELLARSARTPNGSWDVESSRQPDMLP